MPKHWRDLGNGGPSLSLSQPSGVSTRVPGRGLGPCILAVALGVSLYKPEICPSLPESLNTQVARHLSVSTPSPVEQAKSYQLHEFNSFSIDCIHSLTITYHTPPDVNQLAFLTPSPPLFLLLASFPPEAFALAVPST